MREALIFKKYRVTPFQAYKVHNFTLHGLEMATRLVLFIKIPTALQFNSCKLKQASFRPTTYYKTHD